MHTRIGIAIALQKSYMAGMIPAQAVLVIALICFNISEAGQFAMTYAFFLLLIDVMSFSRRSNCQQMLSACRIMCGAS